MAVLTPAPFATPPDPLLQVPPEQVDITRDMPGETPEFQAALASFNTQAPLPGDEVPDFALENLNGDTVTLSQFRGQSAVLVVTGSASCFAYRRYARPYIEQLQQQAASITAQTGRKLEVLLVYVKEAHPALDPSPYSDTQWTGQANVDDKILVRTATSRRDRWMISRAFVDQYQLDLKRVVVDEMDDAVWQQLGGVPNALYLVDVDGKLVFKESWAFQNARNDPYEPIVFGKVRDLLQQ